MWNGTTHGRVTAQTILATAAPANHGPRENGESEDIVAYTYWRDLYPPVVRQLPFTSVAWHFDRVRYAGLHLDSSTGCRSIGHWNRSDQLEYFSAVEGSVSMHLRSAGTDVEDFELSDSAAILGVPPGFWHHTTAAEPATVDNIYCYLRGSSDDKYIRTARPVAFTPALDAESWQGRLLADLFTGDAEHVWKQLDRECLRLAECAAADRG